MKVILEMFEMRQSILELRLSAILEGLVGKREERRRRERFASSRWEVLGGTCKRGGFRTLPGDLKIKSRWPQPVDIFSALRASQEPFPALAAAQLAGLT